MRRIGTTPNLFTSVTMGSIKVAWALSPSMSRAILRPMWVAAGSSVLILVSYPLPESAMDVGLTPGRMVPWYRRMAWVCRPVRTPPADTEPRGGLPSFNEVSGRFRSKSRTQVILKLRLRLAV